MANNMTPAMEALIADNFETTIGGVQLVQPTYLVALLTGDFSTAAIAAVTQEDASAWSEVSTAGSSGYLRVLVGNLSRVGGVLTNDSAITFPACANIAWGTVTGIALTTEGNEAVALTSVAGGNSHFCGAAAANVTVNIGDTYRILAGALSLSFK